MPAASMVIDYKCRVIDIRSTTCNDIEVTVIDVRVLEHMGGHMKARYRTALVLPVLMGFYFANDTGTGSVQASTPASRSAAVIFSASGNGISNTRRFSVPSQWKIAYSFSHCQIPGLSIYVKGGPGDLASDGRKSGSGVQYEYGSGSVYLTMNTACSWRVKVYSGHWVVNGPGLRIGGNDITNTIAFRVPSEWQIHYSFSHCSIPGFSIYVHGGDDDIVSKSGSRGSGVQYEHSGGTISLTVNTACVWQIVLSR